MNNKIKKSVRGFTLLEVLVVLAILAAVSAVAVPGVMGWLPNYRLQGAARELYSNMQKAKSEAVKRNTSVGIAFTTAAFPTTGGSYTVFLDDGTGGGTASNATRDGGERILFRIEMPPNCTLYDASFGGEPVTGYSSRGLPLGNRTGSAKLRNNKSRWYQMSLSNSGYPKITKSTDGTF